MASQVSALNGVHGASRIRRSLDRLSGLLSLRYFMLRVFTAGAAVAGGFAQTFVFARILTPRDFSIYILIGSFGIALWMFDLGAAKILFVRHRARHLAQHAHEDVPAQSNAVIALYTLVVAAGTVMCLAVTARLPASTLGQAVEFAGFFSFSALNLVWYPLRNISNAVDEFVGFETLEAVRRVGHLALMLSLLIGMPLAVFLLLANLLWFVMFAVCFARLVTQGALARHVHGVFGNLRQFWRSNRAELLGSANFYVGDLIIYNFPYLVVPIVYGLGAPTIIVDTVLKVFRGAMLINAAGLDPLVPRQTHAYAERDIVALKKATYTAAALCAVPTALICGALIFASDRLFAFLLGPAARMPSGAVAALVVLLLANLVQNVTTSLMVHNGFFKETARIVTVLVLMMAAMTAIVVGSGAGIVGFIGGYAAVFAAGGALYVTFVVRKIFR